VDMVSAILAQENLSPGSCRPFEGASRPRAKVFRTSVSGKKWECDFLYLLTLLIAWSECREAVSAAPPDALN